MVQVCSTGMYVNGLVHGKIHNLQETLFYSKQKIRRFNMFAEKTQMIFYGKSSNVMGHGFDSNQFSEKVWASAKPTGVGFKNDEIRSLLQWNLHNIYIQDSIYSRWTMNLPKNEQFLVGGLEHLCPYIGNSSPNWRTHIFQRGRYSTNQIWLYSNLQENV